jgi:predicted dehydrogenase
MYQDFARSIRAGRQPEMSLERAMDDQRLMDQIYASVELSEPVAVGE